MDPLFFKLWDLLVDGRVDEAKTILGAEISRFEAWADQRDQEDHLTQG